MTTPVHSPRRYIRRHLILGWWSLLVFLSLGIALEAFHGLKIAAYLDPPYRWRRLMWTLAHAHGTLFSLIHLAFAQTLERFGPEVSRQLRLASFLLIDALILLPLGFFLGGIGHTETDPGIGVLLVPIGAVTLLAGVGLVAWSVTTKKEEDSSA